HGDRLGALEGRDGRDGGVLVGRILVHDGDRAVALAGGDVDQLFVLVPAERVDAGAILDLRDDLAVRRVNDDRRAAAADEEAVRLAIHRDSRRAFARGDVPRGGDGPRLGVDDV